MRLPSKRETRFCHPSAIVRARNPRVLSALLYNHCQARTSQFVIRARRNAARTLSCCLANWMNAKRMIAANDPHKRIERISSQSGLAARGERGCAGGMIGKGGGLEFIISGAPL